MIHWHHLHYNQQITNTCMFSKGVKYMLLSYYLCPQNLEKIVKEAVTSIRLTPEAMPSLSLAVISRLFTNKAVILASTALQIAQQRPPLTGPLSSVVWGHCLKATWASPRFFSLSKYYFFISQLENTLPSSIKTIATLIFALLRVPHSWKAQVKKKSKTIYCSLQQTVYYHAHCHY